MSAIDVAPDASFGLRTEQGGPPARPDEVTDGGEAVWGAAFRQTNSVVSALQYMRNSGSYAPVPGYNPVTEIKGWGDPRYFLDHGHSFVGSQSPAETQAIKSQIDQEETDRRTLAAGGKIGFIAQMGAGLLDPTLLLPGGVAVDATRGGLSFTKAAVNLGKAGLMQTVAQEALLHASQDTRSYEESAINVATGTMLTALLGGAAASYLGRAERAAIETKLYADRAEMNTHAGNPQTGEMAPTMAAPEPGNENLPAGTGQAVAAGAAASDTRQLELVPFGLSEVPGVRTVVEKTSPMQRLFGSASPTARRTAADAAETSLLMRENLEGGVTTAGPAVDREARLHINQGQVAVGDELSKLYSDYRFGDLVAAPRAQGFVRDMLGQNPEGKMSYDQFKEAVTEAARNGDKSDNPQVQMAAQFIRNKVFEPWKKRAIDIGLLGEDVDVKTADSYVQRLYNKQAIAAKRPEFVDRVTDWLAADQQAKAEAQTKIGLYHGAMTSHDATIEKLQGRIAKLEADADVIAARQEETTRLNKAANQRARKLREGADQDTLPLQNARGGAVFETLARNRGNLLADRASAKLSEIEGLEQKLAAETASRDSMRAKIEEQIAQWEGKSTTEAKAALKARGDAEKARQAKIDAGESKSKGERLSSADTAVDRAVARILESDRTLSRDELRSRAHEITDRIIGSPDGRLPYDLGMEHGNGHGGSGEPPRGALAAREFNIPDATIADFLENDIEHIVGAHLRTMVPDVLLTEKFGDVRMTEAFRKINDEYAALTDAAKSEKERTRLEKERQGVIDDLAAVRDRIRGTYGISPEQPLRNAARAAAVLKNYNVLTSMGSAALSSLPDMAGVVMRHGMVNTFNDAWAPFFKMLTQQSDVWKEAGRQYRAMGIAVESTLAARHHALMDTLDTYHPQSRVERTMQWATGKFQFVNMLAPWTDFAKVNASLVAGSEILRATKAAAEGTASARQLRTLGESGIEPHMAARIDQAFQAGGEVRDGVHLPNTAEWADAEARRVFEGAVARDVDISVITPGQEKPLWMSHPILSVIGQFKSFTAAATERILISNLQRRDAQVLQGLMFSMGLGMLSYKLGSLTGGTPTSDKPQDWIKEAISKGGVLGWFEEGNALASKVTRGGVDVYRLIGADKPLSRFASRSAMDQILGPTAGKIGGILSVGSAISKPSEWSEADSKALRRLVAGQNTFYLRGLFNQVEEAGNNAFGIEMKAKPENR
ncbi:hypothetical protein [Bradyrhizobium sp. Arg816]|uniref:hypothetical protein n=1 Tax=Bradyrhizobium sp. Arg816 TaxID=2998491 RepID=UPI00249DF8C1|nr:hypothetical protein [Bradyrhizobium sp. Arg816]MDI3563566.1 hypothetical protein [Bradyrhizobium sp. Arg816]